MGGIPPLIAITPRILHRILIANRAEIARRVMRTCREMGIETVAVYTAADHNALHVREAALAVGVSSYLDVEEIVAAARRTGADAIHPGYGFLAENAAFAEACEQAGVSFIGPPADVIRLAGSKIRAREAVAAAGVHVVPAIDPARPDFPLLVKASAGGGGRGMRLVHDHPMLEAALESAGREAASAFGDGALLLERYIAGARHIEVQIVADSQGHVIHLGDRECSLQRRYQKVIEESPSPALNETQRKRICAAALSAAEAVGYRNAGTVEFLLAPSGDFYFIEINARIQVEHPVTEMVTGLDLVRMQIEIAEGRPLREKPVFSGHAMEARLCAEDPANEFLPSSGKIHDWTLPATRVDHAVEPGMEVSVLYDSLLGKVIVHAPDRASAARKMAASLKALHVAGPRTNRDFLIRTVEHPVFLAGDADTGFFERYLADLTAPPDADTIMRAAIAAAEHQQAKWRWPGIPPNYRNNPYREASCAVEIAGQRIDVCLATQPSDGIRRRHHIVDAGDTIFVDSLAVKLLPRFPDNAAAAQPEIAQASMPGRVLKVLVSTGQSVKTGDPLLVLEAMKMEHTFRSHRDGVVETVFVTQGGMVAPGDRLVKVANK
jgi:propionyl-CoA carboxylase alpha chain